MDVPVSAVRAALPDVPFTWQDDPTAPGPFSFGTDRRLKQVLSAAGFRSTTIDALDADVEFSTRGLPDAVKFALQTGPAARLIGGLSPEQRQRAEDAVARALGAHLIGTRVALRGAAWIVSARAG